MYAIKPVYLVCLWSHIWDGVVGVMYRQTHFNESSSSGKPYLDAMYGA